MVEARRLSADAGDVLVLVGTAKGAFILRAGDDRASWSLAGPFFAGQSIDALALDTRVGRCRLLVGARSSHWGPSVFRSDDLGRTWAEPAARHLAFPPDADAAVANVWQIALGRPGEDDVVWAGVEPAALFRSGDGGATFELVSGLWDHPHRSQWDPGGGGLCLHTVICDPNDDQRMWVGISTGGVYRSDDGGRNWQPRNAGIRVTFMPEEYPEFGQCVHKVTMHPQRPDTLYLQHHFGVYRSDDGGDHWQSVGEGLPADFGFPVVVDPHDPDTVYLIPLESDMFRCTPQGRCRVYRSTARGEGWKALEHGLPQQDAHVTVLRDGFAADALAPTGLYFGTRGGEVFGSADGGETWQELVRHLPPVHCVKTGVVA